MYFIHKNIPNKKVKIHKSNCGFCNNGLGNQQTIHGTKNSDWFPQNSTGFKTFTEANNFAEAIAKEIKTKVSICKRCNPQ